MQALPQCIIDCALTPSGTTLQDLEKLYTRPARDAAAAAKPRPEGPEVQPNAEAPLLRDDRARRKWVAHELGRCCEVRSSLWSGRVHCPLLWQVCRAFGLQAVSLTSFSHPSVPLLLRLNACCVAGRRQTL